MDKRATLNNCQELIWPSAANVQDVTIRVAIV